LARTPVNSITSIDPFNDFYYAVDEICEDDLEEPDYRPLRPLGEFECAILLAVIRLGEEAYGVSIRTELERTLDRDISVGAVYTTLERLLGKGMVAARQGASTPERGGRAKKLFTILSRGSEALEHTRRLSQAMWAISPTGSR
jgi:PadR family transcriptional regulator PadR